MIEVKIPTMEVDAADVRIAVRVTKKMLEQMKEKKPGSVEYSTFDTYLTGRKDVLLELGLWTED